ncbi:hypothetical protein Ahy_B09g096265 [Arachis hypogaea]|uniref:Uncharacterized protein n=1 Tax=Arachis hypogaea TaxID=3818 RepID=A0A444XJF8_ARAHY|nr:hypothetical protein Ahy_B09g096265 [Arachis hypogaea]
MFELLISKGVVYVFAYFGISNNCGLYHTISHHFLLFLQARTTVLPSFYNAIPLYGIKLVPFRKIMRYSPQHPFLVDVAGVMTGVEGERKYVKDRCVFSIAIICISFYILKFNVAVLGEMVDRIKGFVATGEQLLPVVIFQFARVKTFRGM